MTTRVLNSRPLTAEAFRPFGDVIETEGHQPLSINYGLTERFDDLARVDTDARGGAVAVNVFRSQPVELPLAVNVMERHPLASQAFYPLQDRPWLILVAAAELLVPTADALHLFRATGTQGINYARGVWHHYLMVLEAQSDFVVIDRKGPGNNCDEHRFDTSQPILIEG